MLLDEARGMYERYSALFALRNHGGEEAVSAIIDSLGAKSALLKHEVWQCSFNLCLSLYATLMCVLYNQRDLYVCQLATMQVAYVLGQLQNKAASAALSNILRNENEHPMVRHEAAEALGSIAGNDYLMLIVQHKLLFL